MKTKQFGKKLNLNKETIVDLDKHTMTNIKGGYILSNISWCPTCPSNRTCNTCAPYTCNCIND